MRLDGDPDKNNKIQKQIQQFLGDWRLLCFVSASFSILFGSFWCFIFMRRFECFGMFPPVPPPKKIASLGGFGTKASLQTPSWICVFGDLLF